MITTSAPVVPSLYYHFDLRTGYRTINAQKVQRGIYVTDHSYRVELSVTTTYAMDPRSSLHGVQCVKNLSSPLERASDRSVKRFMLAEMA